MKKKFVYLVQFDYSTNDCGGIENYIFSSYEKAVNKFNEIMEFEKTSEYSWCHYAYENDNKQDYEIDEFTDPKDRDNLWWNVKEVIDYNLHDFLDLKKMEVE